MVPTTAAEELASSATDRAVGVLGEPNKDHATHVTRGRLAHDHGFDGIKVNRKRHGRYRAKASSLSTIDDAKIDAIVRRLYPHGIVLYCMTCALHIFEPERSWLVDHEHAGPAPSEENPGA